jgi:hypothetical protein
MESLSSIIDRLAIDVVPFIVLLIIPILRRMSDQVWLSVFYIII